MISTGISPFELSTVVGQIKKLMMELMSIRNKEKNQIVGQSGG